VFGFKEYPRTGSTYSFIFFGMLLIQIIPFDDGLWHSLQMEEKL
jgi:hypothetical protein